MTLADHHFAAACVGYCHRPHLVAAVSEVALLQPIVAAAVVASAVLAADLAEVEFAAVDKPSTVAPSVDLAGAAS